MKSRSLLFGVVIAALGVVLQLLYMRRFEEQASGGAKIEVLVASQPIERGKPITSDVLGVRAVPQSYVDDRMIRASEREKVLGLRAATKVPVLQTLVWTDLISTTDERRDLSSLVQPGNRAVAIQVVNSEIMNLIRPGDFVDLLTIDGRGNRTSVLMQRVLVLAVGLDTSIDGPKNQRSGSSLLTLSVSLQEAQLLNLAMSLGRIAAVVRNASDPRTQDMPPDITQTDLFEPEARRAVQRSTRRPVKLERGTNQ